MKKERNKIYTWEEIKDRAIGEKGTPNRDRMEREASAFLIGLQLRELREKAQLTQEEFAQKVNKKRSYISRVENDAGNMTLRTLLELFEVGLGKKVIITIK
jgi:DNA-binding XRE family transcriptional regulator